MLARPDSEHAEFAREFPPLTGVGLRRKANRAAHGPKGAPEAAPHEPPGASHMAPTGPPIDSVQLVRPYPDARPTKDALPLSAIAAGRPMVLHLFTG